MELQFWALTDVGRVRKHNEDNFLVDKRLNLFVICDGMGGHAAGEVASALTVRTVREIVSAHRDVVERHADDPEDPDARKAVLAMLERAVQEAGAKTFETAQEDASRRGMGTTCSVLLLQGNRGFIAHVGDSRIYLRRGGQIHQMTEDHSLVNELIRMGKIRREDAEKFAHKNAVTRAVGVREYVEVDTLDFDVYGEDRFLLCSDGLCGYFDGRSAVVHELMGVPDLRGATERCIAFARDAGGKDNITAIIVEAVGTEADRLTAEVAQTHELLRSTPFFEYLSLKELVQLLNLARRVQVLDGAEVLRQGEPASGTLYIVASGRLVAEYEGRPVGELTQGKYFGELGFLDEDVQHVTVRAVEDSEMLALRRSSFMELLRREPSLAVKLLWNLIQEFSGTLRKMPVELLFVDEPLRTLSHAAAAVQLHATQPPEADRLAEREGAVEASPPGPLGGGRSGETSDGSSLTVLSRVSSEAEEGADEGAFKGEEPSEGEEPVAAPNDITPPSGKVVFQEDRLKNLRQHVGTEREQSAAAGEEEDDDDPIPQPSNVARTSRVAEHSFWEEEKTQTRGFQPQEQSRLRVVEELEPPAPEEDLRTPLPRRGGAALRTSEMEAVDFDTLREDARTARQRRGRAGSGDGLSVGDLGRPVSGESIVGDGGRRQHSPTEAQPPRAKVVRRRRDSGVVTPPPLPSLRVEGEEGEEGEEDLRRTQRIDNHEDDEF